MRANREPRKGRRRGSRPPLPRWAMAIAALCVAGTVALVVYGVWRKEALVQWRRSLELPGERVEWPAWDPAWPALPSVRRSGRTVPIDVAGPAAFAVRHAEVMRHIPCYCGSCPADHRSNLNCYVARFRPDGGPEWTDHAATCPICVNVTREVMLMLRRGWALPQIRDTLDREYARAGYRPSTQTPHPAVR